MFAIRCRAFRELKFKSLTFVWVEESTIECSPTYNYIFIVKSLQRKDCRSASTTLNYSNANFINLLLLNSSSFSLLSLSCRFLNSCCFSSSSFCTASSCCFFRFATSSSKVLFSSCNSAKIDSDLRVHKCYKYEALYNLK